VGGGQCGNQYKTVHAVNGIDLCEYHDESRPREPAPGDAWNGIAVRLRQCRQLARPLFTGEPGLRPNDANGTGRGHAKLLNAKLRGQLHAGSVGILPWTWRNRENGGSARHDYFIGPGDAALIVSGNHADGARGVHVCRVQPYPFSARTYSLLPRPAAALVGHHVTEGDYERGRPGPALGLCDEDPRGADP
jgi:hypothetical protein